MMQHHKYSLTELDNLMPFERDIYVELLVNYIREENDRIKDQQASRRYNGRDIKRHYRTIKNTKHFI